MNARPIQDSRKFFVMPQGYEGGGYYVYGTPGDGNAQFSSPKLISLVTQIASAWAAQDSRKFGVGNVSRAGGGATDHETHRSGLEVDIRPLRKDGRQVPCLISDGQYDREATRALIQLFFETQFVQSIIFNDGRIAGVRSGPGHSNHFHVTLHA
jgi:penicillin-insensitive murein endopeptidase